MPERVPFLSFFLPPDLSRLVFLDFFDELFDIPDEDFELWLRERNPIAANDFLDKCANKHVSSLSLQEFCK